MIQGLLWSQKFMTFPKSFDGFGGWQLNLRIEMIGFLAIKTSPFIQRMILFFLWVFKRDDKIGITPAELVKDKPCLKKGKKSSSSNSCMMVVLKCFQDETKNSLSFSRKDRVGFGGKLGVKIYQKQNLWFPRLNTSLS